jgi:RNA polymerase sigma-70 factor (ECF subfamily)
MVDDLTHVENVCRGNDNAFRFLIRNHQQMAFTIASTIIHDAFIVQEVVQDAFVKAYQNLHKFNKQSRFGTWFYRIVVNEALMRKRKIKADKLDFTGTIHETEMHINLDDFSQDEINKLVDEALQMLSVNESLALRLFYLQEESIKNVSGITGWTEANTKTILHRARKKMNQVLSLLKNRQ